MKMPNLKLHLDGVVVVVILSCLQL